MDRGNLVNLDLRRRDRKQKLAVAFFGNVAGPSKRHVRDYLALL